MEGKRTLLCYHLYGWSNGSAERRASLGLRWPTLASYDYPTDREQCNSKGFFLCDFECLLGRYDHQRSFQTRLIFLIRTPQNIRPCLYLGS
jgi:hypothetical protein